MQGLSDIGCVSIVMIQVPVLAVSDFRLSEECFECVVGYLFKNSKSQIGLIGGTSTYLELVDDAVAIQQIDAKVLER